MPVLPRFDQFEGRHWETGSVSNALAYAGARVPQTKQRYSEALLLGISGGAAFGYFVFDYKGHDPHVALLSRNTFDPLQTLLERLAIPQDLFQTSDPKKGERNLIEVLESGRPAIVWADAFSLPYNSPAADQAIWGMLPILVYGHEDGKAYIADRSGKPLSSTADELARARARVKKDKFRVLALGAPDPKKLPGAIQKGIWQCIELFTEPPPKGTRDNFGFAAYQKWANMLTNTRNPQSWERLLAPGSRMYAALAGSEHQPGAFGWARTFPSNQVDDRKLYADFLDEAALILRKPKLKPAGEKFRASSAAWEEL
ncbi:MAG TPA: BtrH N-terminal domain-containing protein, partial [Anaerolineales bacterium]|nr:BtrH N-terminal domain-containing protein [Anaerolineales bacterium]